MEMRMGFGSIEEALFAETERAQVTLNSIGDGVICTDASGNATYLNIVAERLTGWPWRDAMVPSRVVLEFGVTWPPAD
jgi:PAS domain-containing protein